MDILKATFGDSATLLRADYDPIMESLKLYFRSGGIYVYPGVSRDVFEGLRDSESAGRYFVANIKSAYDFIKLG